MRRIAVLFAVLVVSSCAVAQITFGGGSPPEKREKPVTSRTLIGTVLDNDGKPIPDAIVYLKDTKTLQVKTYVSQADGSYRFNALSMNIDYEVYAQKGEKKSPTKKLSQFNDQATPRINLKLDM